MEEARLKKSSKELGFLNEITSAEECKRNNCTYVPDNPNKIGDESKCWKLESGGYCCERQWKNDTCNENARRGESEFYYQHCDGRPDGPDYECKTLTKDERDDIFRDCPPVANDGAILCCKVKCGLIFNNQCEGDANGFLKKIEDGRQSYTPCLARNEACDFFACDACILNLLDSARYRDRNSCLVCGGEYEKISRETISSFSDRIQERLKDLIAQHDFLLQNQSLGLKVMRKNYNFVVFCHFGLQIVLDCARYQKIEFDLMDHLYYVSQEWWGPTVLCACISFFHALLSLYLSEELKLNASSLRAVVQFTVGKGLMNNSVKALVNYSDGELKKYTRELNFLRAIFFLVSYFSSRSSEDNILTRIFKQWDDLFFPVALFRESQKEDNVRVTASGYLF